MDRQKRFVLAILAVLFGVFLVGRGVYGLFDEYQRFVAPKKVLRVETVKSPDRRQMGLSNRDEIGADGMLFYFDQASTQNCFWMKDMRFAIDMIWINEDKRVVTVAENISPDTYPASFCPDAPALYGLEVDAGTASEYGLIAGERVQL